MELNQCKTIVQHLFTQHCGSADPIENKQLVVKNQEFQIRPDHAYFFDDLIVVIEYENTKRPVESISKYWWLFENTGWRTLNLRMQCLVFLLRADLNKIRAESVKILGTELATKYPSLFKFQCLMPAETTHAAIQTCIEATWQI